MTNTLKLKTINFKSGSAPGEPSLTISCPNVTILIGPNNSGKSQTLREVEHDCSGFNSGDPRLLVESVRLDVPDSGDEFMEMVAPYNVPQPRGHAMPAGHFFLRRPALGSQPDLQTFVPVGGYSDWLKASSWQQIKEYFVKFLTRRLDGASRFHLVENRPSGALELAPENHLWSLFMDDDARSKVSAFTQRAFNRFFVIDPTGMNEFRMRLSDRAPLDATEEQAVDPRARAFHSQAALVLGMGDGVKASVGLTAAIHSLPDRILLVDEPEAFLHPTLARRMGRMLSETARERDASLVVATHSSEFLIGCMQATTDLRLVRLTYEGGQSTARTLAPADIAALMNDPLLRSANALRALFHRGVVVCEADADRAFYEEANVRLGNAGRGTEDALFMNAQNWQTIPRIAVPLRRLGVPAAAVFDLDVLMDTDFKMLWSLVQLSPADLADLKTARAAAKLTLEKHPRSDVKKLGLAVLSDEERPAVEALLERFAVQGMFFVSVGELEGWLSAAGITVRDKAKWVIAMFAHMGDDPQATGYLAAGTDDVWHFLSRVRSWIDDPARGGIPLT